MKTRTMKLMIAVTTMVLTLTGCVDAVGEGAADGVRDGLSATLSAIITNAFAAAGVGG